MQADILLASDDSKKTKKAFFAVTSKLEKQLNFKKPKSATFQEGIVQSLHSYIFNRIRKAKQSKISAARKPKTETKTKNQEEIVLES